ncbi:MAG TPA: PadR family transcriptional regulator [Candidatus Glassbacteria bacterium]|nr:PadR family transcriptional regulator [Candidatus Glassbacteria bacterium]
MNPKELIILSLIYEKPSHAYTLEEKIEQRGMRNWTEIGFSSIYRIITNLEKKGFVKSVIIQEEEDARIKKKYTITKKGQTELKIAVRDALATPTRAKSDFDIGLANVWLLDKDEALTALKQFLLSIKKRREVMFDSWNQIGGKGNIPFLLDALFEHGDVMSKAEMKFVEELVEKIKKHGILSVIDK